MEQSQVLKNLTKLIFSTTEKAIRKAVFVGPWRGGGEDTKHNVISVRDAYGFGR